MTNDQPNTATAYVLGKIFAVLERIRREAVKPQDSLASRYLGSASSTPRSVFSTLTINAQYHLEKIENTNKRKAKYLNKELGSLFSHIQHFPATLTLIEQGEFVLGYYHQQDSFWTKKEESE